MVKKADLSAKRGEREDRMTKEKKRKKKQRIDTIRRNRKALGYSTKKCVVKLMEDINQTMTIENALHGFEKKGYEYEINDGLVIY